MIASIRLTKDLTASDGLGSNFSPGTEGILAGLVGGYSLIDIPLKRLRERVRPLDIELSGVFRGRVRGSDSYVVIAN